MLTPSVTCRQEDQAVSFFVRDVGGPRHGPLCVLGAGAGGERHRRRVPVLLREQGPGGGALGPEEGQQEAHDVSEDVTGAEKLRALRGDFQGEAEAHLPVWPGHPAVTTAASPWPTLGLSSSQRHFYAFFFLFLLAPL